MRDLQELEQNLKHAKNLQMISLMDTVTLSDDQQWYVSRYVSNPVLFLLRFSNYPPPPPSIPEIEKEIKLIEDKIQELVQD